MSINPILMENIESQYCTTHTSLLTVRAGLSGNTVTEFPVVVVKSF